MATRETSSQQYNPYEQAANMPYYQQGQTFQNAQQYQPRQTFQPAPQKPVAPKVPAKMPKQQAMALVEQVKQWVVVSSVLVFGVIGGLTVGYTVGSTSIITTTSKTTAASTSSNIFQQGGFSFGSSNSSNSSQVPVSSTRVS